MGHHVAILLDISCDGRGGTTYLANSVMQAVGLVEYRSLLREPEDRRGTSRQIAEWLKGLDEKAKLLEDKKRKKLFAHMDCTVKRLVRQRRGDVAQRLTQDMLLSDRNRIIPAFNDLSTIVKRLEIGMRRKDYQGLLDISRRIVRHTTLPSEDGDLQAVFADIKKAIHRWAMALSGEMQDEAAYRAARLYVKEGESFRMYVVAYDLIGSSGPRYSGRPGWDRDRRVQSIISNWFIAFGGYAQHTEYGGGDLGFGFFHSPMAAVQATLWAGYHLNLLKHTDPLLKQDKPHAGFGIVQDELRPGFIEQVRSDLLSRVAKAWKREAERIADNAGRDGWPIVAVHHDMFSGMQELPAPWLGAGTELDGITVRFVKSEAMSRLPWVSSV